MPTDIEKLYGFVFWGASGHAKVLAEVASLLGSRVLALFDNDTTRSSPLEGVPIHFGIEGFNRWAESCGAAAGVGALSAIGGSRGHDRLAFLDMFARAGFATPSLVHPTAYVSPSATIGLNCHILARATVCVDVVIGDATIVNTAASVDHECVLREGVHVGPGATLCGCVIAERNVFVGAGATVMPRVHLGENTVVGAGAVVIRDVPSDTVVVGNPARPLKERSHVAS